MSNTFVTADGSAAATLTTSLPPTSPTSTAAPPPQPSSSLSFFCRNEDEERLAAAARVVASSSPEAREDEAQLTEAATALREAKNKVRELAEQIATRQAARASSESAGGSDARALPLSPEALAFRLRRAEREAERLEEKLFHLEEKVAERRQRRLAAAIQQQRVEAQWQREEAQRLKAEAAARHAERQVALGVVQDGRSGRSIPIRPLSQLPRTTTTTTTRANAATSSGGGGGGGARGDAGVSWPSSSTSRPTTRKEYAGGDVLPNVYRVDVRAAKHVRYVDDTSMEDYTARLAKRRKLESIQHEQEENVKKEEEAEAEAKQEEEAEEEEGGLSTAVRRRSTSPSSSSMVTKSSARSMEVIDVDALMEAEEDELVQQLQEHGVMGTRARKVTKREEDEERSPAAARGGGNRRRGGGARKEEDEDRLLPVPVVSLTPRIKIPVGVYTRLLDFQQEGLQWLVQLHEKRAGGILGDEMGLGKTVQIAAMICALAHSHQLLGPVLLVAPVTVLRQWVAELHRWSPTTRVLVLHQGAASASSRSPSPASMVDTVRGLSNAVLLTSYATMRQHCELLTTAGFHYVILDEGHKISNPLAGITLAAKSFATPHRLMLTGSPIQNSLKELWCLFDFVKPGIFGSLAAFTSEFEEVITKSKNAKASPLMLAEAVEAARVLQDRMAPYLLRRLKRQVNAQLPEKYERVVYVPLSDEQLDAYAAHLASREVQTLIAQVLSYHTISGGLNRDFRDSSGSLHVAGRDYRLANKSQLSGLRVESFRIFHDLRQICNHIDIFRIQKEYRRQREKKAAAAASPSAASVASPSKMLLFSGEVLDEDMDGDDASPGGGDRGKKKNVASPSFRSNLPPNLGGSAKLQTLRLMLREWKEGGHRALVFSQTRMMLDIIENMMEQEAHRYVRMDGATPVAQRQEIMDTFNADESIFLALLTTRVGGVGLNLIGADRVVIFDPDWNPTTDAQARERSWRVGQQRDVCVYRLITLGTVEEFMFKRQLAKGYVTDKVLRDASYQRFFMEESFVEGLLLGSVYDARLPDTMKHILLSRDPNLYEKEKQEREEQRRGMTREKDGGNGEFVVDIKEFGQECHSDIPRGGGAGGGEEEASSTAPPPSSPSRAYRFYNAGSPTAAEIKQEMEEEDVAPAAGGGGRGGAAVVVSSHACGPSSPVGSGEQLSVLRHLVDGVDVHDAPQDIVHQRLASFQAQRRLQRVLRQSASTTEATQRHGRQ